MLYYVHYLQVEHMQYLEVKNDDCFNGKRPVISDMLMTNDVYHVNKQVVLDLPSDGNLNCHGKMVFDGYDWTSLPSNVPPTTTDNVFRSIADDAWCLLQWCT